MDFKNIFFTLSLLTPAVSIAYFDTFSVPQLKKSSTTSSIFQGSVKFPTQVQDLPHLSILYKGNEYKIEVDQDSSGNKGYFELYEQPRYNELYLIVTESLQSPKQNSIKCLKTSALFPYKLFKLTRSSKTIESDILESEEKTKQKRTIEFWSIQECDNSKKDVDLPDNTIVFPMDPTVVLGLKEESWDADDNIIKLPTIMFQESLENSTMQDIAARVACALIDVKFMHTKLSMSEKMTNDRKLVLPLANNSIQNSSTLKSFRYG